MEKKKFIISHRFSVEVQLAGLSFVVALENKATESYCHLVTPGRVSSWLDGQQPNSFTYPRHANG